MTRLRYLNATAHPVGNRIDLRWAPPEPATRLRVRVVRREGTHPGSPDDGIVVADGEPRPPIADTGLRGDTVYYYSFFTYDPSDPSRAVLDPANRVVAMATARHGYAEQMAELLPGIYHRYDDAEARRRIPGDSSSEDATGPLRHLLEITGGHLDELHSLANAALRLHDIERVDGRALPLLGDWIGWPTDHRLDIAGQRNELRHAPHIYRTIGVIPTIEATVKRVLGWESRVKEFAHNVFRSNQPERLNLWVHERSVAGDWSSGAHPLSLNFAYDGRPSAVRDSDGREWLVYHTLRNGRWDIWCKTHDAQDGWSPSQPLAAGPRIDTHPVAVRWGKRILVLWQSFGQHAGDGPPGWRIESRTRLAGSWRSGPALWTDAIERRQPCAVADDAGGLWLFWLERVGERWQLRYNRWAGSTWAMPAADFPSDGPGRTPADPFLLFQAAADGARLWVFWARNAPTGEPGQTRWEIVYRIGDVADSGIRGWGPIRALPGSSEDDREPAACIDGGGRVRVFWASSRDRSYSIWSSTTDASGESWTPPERLTGNPFSHRAPLPMPLEDGRLLLVYRSNESIGYASTVYGATRTLDSRYAGCTTVDTRNTSKTALRQDFRDFQTYTYDTGHRGYRDDRNWYAMDTIGVYLRPTAEDPDVILRNRGIIHRVLREFLPLQVRAVLIIEPAPFTAKVYTYDFAGEPDQRRIGEGAFDSTVPEALSRVRDRYTDTVLGWSWLRSWRDGAPLQRSVDFTTSPIHASHRTWHIGIEPGEPP